MSAAGPLVAIVDDDQVFMGMLRDFLEGEGYRVITWATAADADGLILRERPDLVILDIRLEKPESGRVILERLRREPQTADIPVIVCSADTRFLERHRVFLRRNASAVLEKPFNLDDLLSAVDDAIGRPPLRHPPGALDSDASF